MKRLNIISILAACVLTLPVVADSYRGVPGSSVKIAGTSTVHDWVVDSQLIGGSMELNGDLAKPGKVDAKAKALISVRSLKSGKKAEFALDLLEVETFDKVVVPRYIAEGLKWLLSELKRKQVENLLHGQRAEKSEQTEPVEA